MKIKTADLTGPALDWAVAQCESVEVEYINDGRTRCLLRVSPFTSMYHPTVDWAIGGPLIEREEVGLKRNAPCSRGREWEASPSITAKGAGGKWGYGPTPLIAAMRCLVASRLGDEVDVPEELLKWARTT